MREDFPQQPACQMPQVTCPHPLYTVASGELGKDGVYPVTKPAEDGTPFGMRVSLLGGVWCQKLYAHTRQIFFGLWRMVVSISDEQTGSSLDDLRHDGKLVGVSRGHREVGDQTRPGDLRVHPKAVEGLPEERVLAEGGFSFEALAAIGSGEQASRQGHRVADGEGRVVRGEAKQILPEAFLHFPEIGRLPGEGGAVHLGEGGEPLGVVPSEEEVNALVGIDAEELADYLYGENLRVRELWSGTTLADGSLLDLVSIRQKTETMKVLRSIRRDLLRFDWFGHHRA
jgi:hypothetical protein